METESRRPVRNWKRQTRRTLRFIFAPAPQAPRSIWTRAADWALLASFILAVFLQWLFAAEHCKTVTVIENESPIFKQDVATNTLGFHHHGLSATEHAVGFVTWKMQIQQCGWPFMIYDQPLPLLASWTLDDPPETRNDFVVPRDHPLAIPLQAELAQISVSKRANLARIGTSLSLDWEDPPGGRILWWNTIFAVGLIWMVLYLAIRFPIALTRALLILHRRIYSDIEGHRSRSGRCLKCGYDLKGLEMAEKCPECGSLLW